MTSIRKPAAGLAIALGLALASLGAAAETAYPCPTVKLVSPYPPGGTTDILARLVAPGLGKELGTNVIVDNKAGASSNIGTEYVSASAPDGCTLLLGN
ncbi:MAG: Bug family tripartite tricarboxylate transporter substrate binding protein, partial [Ramlibacter sp.]